MAPLPFLPPVIKGRHEVPAVEVLVQYTHVALGSPGVILVTLLQDHYCVLHLAVRKVNPEVGLI